MHGVYGIGGNMVFQRVVAFQQEYSHTVGSQHSVQMQHDIGIAGSGHRQIAYGSGGKGQMVDMAHIQVILVVVPVA